MNASDFARELLACAPSIASLEGVGLSFTEAEMFRRGYSCLSKVETRIHYSQNEVLELATNWDVGEVEVGLIRLVGTPSSYQGIGTKVGLVEIAPLIFLTSSSELIVLDNRDSGHLLWKVAESPGQFLDALVIAAKFLGERAVGAVDFEDLESARVAANNCSTAAGGELYHEFYLMLLGAESL
jgi:hypothetical protein